MEALDNRPTASFHSLTAPLTPYRWPRCAGTGIGQKAATLCSSVFSIPLAYPTQNGVCSISAMQPAT
ncbi:hypothetical protein ACSSVV_002851 [Marinobacter sp. MBR-105]|jgi:hypothetical protein